MMRGLFKATGYYNTRQAWIDFAFLAQFAANNGAEDAVKIPPTSAGHRTVDRYIGNLRNELTARGITSPALPSRGEGL
jgi:hypothetical protein